MLGHCVKEESGVQGKHALVVVDKKQLEKANVCIDCHECEQRFVVSEQEKLIVCVYFQKGKKMVYV